MANELMKLKLKAGSCFINGYYAYDNFDGEITLEPASSDLNRIDRIVTRLDRINRKISIEVKKGAYGTTSYSAPSIQRDDDIWELGLADVLVKKGTTQIVQANITDIRAIQEYCGYVYNPMQNIDTTDLFAQYDNSFEVWFQHVKEQLSTDAAGNLQKQIDTHTSQLADKQNKNDSTLTTENKTIVGAINENNASLAELVNGFINSKGDNGYTRLPNGLILQWGLTYVASNGINIAVSFPVAFPTKAATIQITNLFHTSTAIGWSVGDISRTGFRAFNKTYTTDTTPTVPSNCYWMAIGY